MNDAPLRRRRPTTLKDLAAETGLSVSTISRALANNPVISTETRAIVKEAATRLRYRPNAHAASLRSQRTNIIGVVIPDIENPFFATLAAAIQQVARSQGYSILLGHTEEDPALFQTTMEVFASQRVDGMIVVPSADSEELFIDILDQGIPVVAVDRRAPLKEIPSVVSDPRPGLEAAVQALLANDGARLGYLAGPQDTSTGKERLEILQSLVEEAGAEVVISYGGYNQRDGYNGTVELLGAGVNAILAGDAMLTIGAMQALCERQIAVGRDCALVGFDELPMFLFHNPPLTTIDQQVRQMGTRAFELLTQMLGSDENPDSAQIPTILHTRRSSTLG